MNAAPTVRSPVARSALAAAASAAVLRWALEPALPVLLTQDSTSYLRIANDLCRGLGWSDPRLGVLRMPGYPLFLAGIQSFAAPDAAAIAAMQALLGIALAAAVAGIVAARTGALPGWLAGTLATASPAQLALERAVMPEALAVALAVTAVAFGLAWCRRPGSAFLALAAGVVAAAAVLTRLNLALLLGCVAIAGCVSGAIAVRAGRLRPAAWLAAVVAAATATALLITPWLLRNERRIGSPALLAGGARVKLVYAMQRGLVSRTAIDREIPGLDLDGPNPPMTVFWRLVADGDRGVATARALLAETAETRGDALRAARWRSLLDLVGFRSAASSDLASWIRRDADTSRRIEVRASRYLSGPAPPGSTAARTRLAAAVEFQAHLFRPALVVLALVAGSWWILRSRSTTAIDLGWAAVWAGLLATLALHSVSLASYDRFAAMVDPIWVTAAVGSLPRRSRLPATGPLG